MVCCKLYVKVVALISNSCVQAWKQTRWTKSGDSHADVVFWVAMFLGDLMTIVPYVVLAGPFLFVVLFHGLMRLAANGLRPGLCCGQIYNILVTM